MIHNKNVKDNTRYMDNMENNETDNNLEKEINKIIDEIKKYNEESIKDNEGKGEIAIKYFEKLKNMNNILDKKLINQMLNLIKKKRKKQKVIENKEKIEENKIKNIENIKMKHNFNDKVNQKRINNNRILNDFRKILEKK